MDNQNKWRVERIEPLFSEVKSPTDDVFFLATKQQADYFVYYMNRRENRSMPMRALQLWEMRDDLKLVLRAFKQHIRVKELIEKLEKLDELEGEK